jgi:shikimate kinase
VDEQLLALPADASRRRHLVDRPVDWVAMAGFMGTGKSRIGWELSRRLQLTFIDTDRVIERVSSMRISEIFELYGEAVFRDYETEIVRRCTRLDDVVISTGGGTVVRPENRALLRARGPVVVLQASAETIYKRTRRHRRPMLEVGDPEQRIRDLMAQRTPFYDEVASVTVSTDGRDSQDVVDEIVEKLEAWAERQTAPDAGREANA